MGTATIIINVSGVTVACLDWNVEDIRTEFNGAQTIYNDLGEEITIPVDAAKDIIPGDNSEECTKYSFGEVEIYVEFLN